MIPRLSNLLGPARKGMIPLTRTKLKRRLVCRASRNPRPLGLAGQARKGMIALTRTKRKMRLV